MVGHRRKHTIDYRLMKMTDNTNKIDNETYSKYIHEHRVLIKSYTRVIFVCHWYHKVHGQCYSNITKYVHIV